MQITAADYVMTQPPVYTGPEKPEDPLAPTKKKRGDIPEVEDFLANAKAEFDFVPEAPADEITYKRAYAAVASAKGLNKEECVKIYGFESGGDGKYDIQAGREYDMKARVISTALGYNQLLTTNTVGLLAEDGDDFIAELAKRMEGADGERTGGPCRQDRQAEEDDRLCADRAQRLERPRPPRRHAEGHRHACAQSRRRRSGRCCRRAS